MCAKTFRYKLQETIKCDAEYPKILHDYPFFPRHKIIKYEELSDYQQKLISKSKHNPSKKLIADLANKIDIVVDYRTLKQAISHGLKLKKIHSAIKYDQKPWLKDYIL